MPEGLPTDAAPVWLLAGVNELVLPEHRAVTKGFPALTAHVRPLPCGFSGAG